MAYGDHLVVGTKYPLVEHHGIECDSEQVIHFVKNNSTNERLEIRKTSLQEFANGRKVYVIDYCGEKSLNPSETVKHAEFLYMEFKKNPETLRYDIVKFNCEHLATFCKILSIESSQILRASLLIRRSSHLAPIKIDEFLLLRIIPKPLI